MQTGRFPDGFLWGAATSPHQVEGDNRLNDGWDWDYLVRAPMHAVRQAIAQGADVRGCYHWSRVDNFEWAEGWATRFGLLSPGRQSQRREVRQSARLHQRVCQANGLFADLEAGISPATDL